MNLGSIFRFCSLLEEQHRIWRNKLIALCSEPDGKSLTNSVFLLGAYMMIRLGQSPANLLGKFEPIKHYLLSYRDVSPGEQNFHLHLEDCWQGIWRARKLGWVDFGPTGFSYDEYVHYDDPLNADLHEVHIRPFGIHPSHNLFCHHLLSASSSHCETDNISKGRQRCARPPPKPRAHSPPHPFPPSPPHTPARTRAQVVPGKFVAMKGPKTLGPGVEWRDGKDGYREFSPAYYADILHEFGVQA